MSAPLRFLALVVVGWGAIRFATGGLPLGSAVFGFAGEAPAAVPPIMTTEFPPIAPFEQAMAPAAQPYPALQPYYYAVPIPVPRMTTSYQAPYYPASAALIPPRPNLDFAASNSADGPLANLMAAVFPPRRSPPAPSVGQAAPTAPAKLDRLQFSTWALLRERNGTPALASGGTLGGSQAGMRLTYAVNRTLAASLRTTSPVGGRGIEVAAGVRYQPLRSVPLWLTAERRQAIGRDGGRSAFALFAESGVYQLPIPGKFQLDGYAQGGVVGTQRRDLFADGGVTFTRPFYKEYSAGIGMWGGVQPGLHRLDVGPRLSMRVRGKMRVHVDWRQRIAGNAAPGSGPALTLAGDF